MNARICIYCRRSEDLSPDGQGSCKVELRPYGPGGALVCFPCAMNPEHKEETDRQYGGRLALIAGLVMLTSEGPAPATQFIRDLSAAPSEKERDGSEEGT